MKLARATQWPGPPLAKASAWRLTKPCGCGGRQDQRRRQLLNPQQSRAGETANTEYLFSSSGTNNYLSSQRLRPPFPHHTRTHNTHHRPLPFPSQSIPIPSANTLISASLTPSLAAFGSDLSWNHYSSFDFPCPAPLPPHLLHTILCVPPYLRRSPPYPLSTLPPCPASTPVILFHNVL